MYRWLSYFRHRLSAMPIGRRLQYKKKVGCHDYLSLFVAGYRNYTQCKALQRKKVFPYRNIYVGKRHNA